MKGIEGGGRGGGEKEGWTKGVEGEGGGAEGSCASPMFASPRKTLRFISQSASARCAPLISASETPKCLAQAPRLKDRSVPFSPSRATRRVSRRSVHRGLGTPALLNAPRRTTLSKRVMLWPTHVCPSIRCLRCSHVFLNDMPPRTISVVIPFRDVV